jgi:glycerol uptake facilitator-like aquaporin
VLWHRLLRVTMSAGQMPSLARRAAAEAIGTGALLAAIVGSGIMGERLAGGNVAIALLANAAATGAALAVLILVFDSISGAHFNPVVSAVAASRRELSWGDAAVYITAQLAGAFAGVICAHIMFGETLLAWSTHPRAGAAEAFSETVATFGLIMVILACARRQPSPVALAVGGYIASAYWFTASTSFANPAVTLARSVTNTFAGIRPQDVPPFLGAQILGAAVAALFFRWLFPPK